MIVGINIGRLDVNETPGLAVPVESSMIILEQMECPADLESFATLEQTGKQQPHPLHSNWVENANKITQNGRNRGFDNWLSFCFSVGRIGRSRFRHLRRTVRVTSSLVGSPKR